MNVYYKRGFCILFGWYVVVHVLKMERSNVFLNKLYSFFGTPYFLYYNFDTLIFGLVISFTMLFFITELKKIHFKNFLANHLSNPLDIRLKNAMKQIWYEYAFKYLYMYLLIYFLYFILTYNLNYHFYQIDLVVTAIFLSWFFLKLYAIPYLHFQVVYCNISCKVFVNDDFTDQSMVKIIVLQMFRTIIENIKGSSSFFQKLENGFVGKRPPTSHESWEKKLMDKVSREMSEGLAKNEVELQKMREQISRQNDVIRSSRSSFLDDGAKVAAIVGVVSTTFFGYKTLSNSLELDLIKVERKMEEEKWLLEKEVLTNQVKEDKVKIADLTKENSKLTIENIDMDKILPKSYVRW